MTVAALLLATLALTPADWASKPLGIRPERTRVERVGRRSVAWYRHAADPAWGGDCSRIDRFTVAEPVGGARDGAPLLVVLHWRGGGVPSGGVDLQTKSVDEKGRVYSAPDDFYVLTLDDMRDYNVWLFRTHDEYWWGATPRYQGPEKGDVARLAQGETSCEKRVLDSVEWCVRTLGIDRERVYLCGNSMGGQATEAIGLAHGEVFAAVCANVPATVWFAAARLGFVDAAGEETDRIGTDARRFADPPPCVDWSGVDDPWSRDREIFYRGMARRRWALMGLWGDYGHCGEEALARRRNDLVGRFDWMAIRRDEPYPAFTGADCDDRLPWPFSVWKPSHFFFGYFTGDVVSAKTAVADGAPRAGQVNGFFRWRTCAHDEDGVAMELWIAGADEIPTQQFSPPEAAVADVTVRRIRSRALVEADEVAWRFGEACGVIRRGADGALTVPRLRLTRARETLRLAVRKEGGR